MPKVMRQTHSDGKPVGPLDKWSTDGDGEVDGVKLLTYGQTKTGKTRLAATFPKPSLLMGSEDGTRSICTSKRKKAVLKCGGVLWELLNKGKATGVDFIKLGASDWLEELVPLLADKYQSGILDHGGGYQDLILKEVLGLEEVPISKFRRAGKGEAWGITDRATWGVVGTQFKERMRMLLDLADRKGKDIVIIAHERTFNDEGTGDVIAPVVGAALTPSAAGWLNGACDYICQTYKRAQVVKKESTIGEGKNAQKIVTEVRTGRIEYCLRIGAHEIFTTGFRVPDGVVLPDSIVNPTYNDIAKLIRG